MNHKQKVGKFGEGLAVKYLQGKGYRIIHRNLQLSYKEIDIIAEMRGITVFIEVKTRSSQAFGTADYGIGRQKIKQLKKAIMYYMNRNQQVKNIRLDLVAIDIDKITKIAKIKHYKDIF